MFRKAVLVIHGFAGGTYDQESLCNILELESKFDVYTYTLPGHDSIINNKHKMNAWISKSEQMVEFLIENGYKKIYVIGHSMGGVIASYLATRYNKIKKLVLAAPSFEYFSSENGEFNLIRGLKEAPDIINNYGKDELISRILKLPPLTINEFIKLVSKYKNTVKDINIPVLIIHGNKDNIVPLSSSENIYNLIPSNKKKLYIIKGVNHDIFRGKKSGLVINLVRDYLKYNITRKMEIEEID